MFLFSYRKIWWDISWVNLFLQEPSKCIPEIGSKMSQARAKLRSARVSSQKARLVANQIRGKHIEEALGILTFAPQKSAHIIKKVLESAIANAEHNQGLDIDSLFVSTIAVDESFTMKRVRARARGRADRYFKRSCNIALTLEEKGK